MSNSRFRYILGFIATLCVVVILFPFFPAFPADNVWHEDAKVFADDGQRLDLFGGAVAIDGDTAVVGAFEKKTEQGAKSGAVYIYVRSGSTWSQQAKLLPNDSEGGERFGESVAIKDNTVIIGATSAWGQRGRIGAAYIFTRSGSTWTQKAKLVPPDPRASSSFARTVDIDGNTAVVGEREAINVFVRLTPLGDSLRDRATDTWTLEARLTPPEQYAHFPDAIAIDGNTIIAGGYVFVRDPSTHTWSVQTKLNPKDLGKEWSRFGDAVAISGNTAAIGAPEDNGDRGSVFVFERDPATGKWFDMTKFTASDLPFFLSFGFGSSIAIDGNTIVVGTCLQKVITLIPGWEKEGIYVFVLDSLCGDRSSSRPRNCWSQQAKLLRKNDLGKYLPGCRVNLSGDHIILGAPTDNGRNPASGVAYIFKRGSSSSSKN